MNNFDYILNYHFTHKTSSIDNYYNDCYERYIDLSDWYCAYVSVDFTQRETHIYVGFKNGSRITSYSIPIADDTDIYDEKSFIDWIECEVINDIDIYND